MPDGASPLEVRILDLEDGQATSHAVGPAIAAAALTLTRTVQAGHPHLMSLGAVIRTGAALEIAFNEALDSALAGFELYLAEGDPPGKRVSELRLEPVGDYDTVRLRPEAGWRAGKTYRLRLTNQVQDVTGNGWLDTTAATHLDVTFEVQRSETFHGYDFQVVRDVARIGNLLLVAAGQQGLWVLDASDPKALKNYLPGDLNFPFPLGDQVQGVEVDPHGRAVVVGGGLTGHGQVKILDIQKLGELLPTIPAKTSQALVERGREDRIAIMNEIAVVVLPGKRFTKLLKRPLCGGMLGHVEIEDPPGAYLHHEKNAEEIEPGRDDGEEVGGEDMRRVVAQERRPALAIVATPATSWPWEHVLPDRPR